MTFRGWPRLTWFVTENLSRASRDWLPPPRAGDDERAYIEYTTASSGDGSVVGVVNSRASMLGHVRALTVACNYTEGASCEQFFALIIIFSFADTYMYRSCVLYDV